MKDMKEHWNLIYSSNVSTKLGWYEEIPARCLELFETCNLNKNDAIIDIGCGTSSFLDNLLSRGFTNLIGVDISEEALEILKQRLGEKFSSIKWIIDDITNPKEAQNIKGAVLWHDRAVLHFLLDGEEQQNYLQTLKTVLQKKGYVIIATFNLLGAKKCSGLDVKNYDENILADFLGSDFKLKESFNYIYQQPSGNTRPYVYTLFQRIS